MTVSDRWLLPAGIEEILPPDAARLEAARRILLDLFSVWGYELVIPPFIEFLPSLLTGAGEDLDLQTFKLTDQLTGHSMGVRADMTPQVARIDAHHYEGDVPVRLCYLGTVLHTRPDGFSGSRSPLQVGAELYGHAGVDSDVEILCLMLETLAVAGVGNVHLDVGHMGVFRALACQAGLSTGQERTLFDALQRKDRAEVEVLTREFAIPDITGSMFSHLVGLNGGADVLVEARRALAAAGPEMVAILDYLDALAAAMHNRAPDFPLHFDLAELRGYQYQTGVVFAAFVPGHGQEIARGGRYDEIGKVFGRARPATGFSTDLKTLVSLQDPVSSARGAILAPCGDDPSLHAAIHKLRAAGERVVCELSGQTGDARAMGCDRMLARLDDKWDVVDVQV